jgi:hypothetical protein
VLNARTLPQLQQERFESRNQPYIANCELRYIASAFHLAFLGTSSRCGQNGDGSISRDEHEPHQGFAVPTARLFCQLQRSVERGQPVASSSTTSKASIRRRCEGRSWRHQKRNAGEARLIARFRSDVPGAPAQRGRPANPNPGNDKALNNQGFAVQNMAEAQRFELRDLLQSAVFKTAALNHSATPPLRCGRHNTVMKQAVKLSDSRALAALL